MQRKWKYEPFQHDCSIFDHNYMSLGNNGPDFKPVLKGQAKVQDIVPKRRTVMLKGLIKGLIS